MQAKRKNQRLLALLLCVALLFSFQYEGGNVKADTEGNHVTQLIICYSGQPVVVQKFPDAEYEVSASDGSVVTGQATEMPSTPPTHTPTKAPSETPTVSPTETPTNTPTRTPTATPSTSPTELPQEAIAVDIQAKKTLLTINETVVINAQLTGINANDAAISWYKDGKKVDTTDSIYREKCTKKGIHTYYCVISQDGIEIKSNSIKVYTAAKNITLTVGSKKTASTIGKDLFGKKTKVSILGLTPQKYKKYVTAKSSYVTAKKYCKKAKIIIAVGESNAVSIGIKTEFPRVKVNFYLSKNKKKLSCVYKNSKNASSVKVQLYNKQKKKWVTVPKSLQKFICNPRQKKSKSNIVSDGKFIVTKYRVYAIYKTDFGKVKTKRTTGKIKRKG